MNVKAVGIQDIEISICGVAELPDYVTHGVTHIVSIWEGRFANDPAPRQRIQGLFPEAHCHFVFFDDAFSDSGGPYPPNRASIGNVLTFAGTLQKGDYLLVHCAAGVSRSTAIAFAALCHHAGPGLERLCWKAVKKIRPSASPNPYVVRIADDLLGRKGAMIRTIQRP